MSGNAKDVAKVGTDAGFEKLPKRRPVVVLMRLLAVTLLMHSASTAQAPNTARVVTWGSNGNGQLGRPNPQSNLSPAAIGSLGPGSGTIAIAAGSSHTLALKSDGTVLAWGSNTNGQLGDGTNVSKLSPTPVSGLGAGSDVIAIAVGASHSLALKGDGTVLSWGLNTNGQLGNGNTTSRNTPGAVNTLGAGSGVTAIAAALGSHSMALKGDGTVLAWGANSQGQVGDGTTTQKTAPVQVIGLGPANGTVAIAAGATHSFARKLDGTLLTWGANSNGQLGDGTTTRKTSPVPVSGFGIGSGVIALAGGFSHSLALKSDGTVWSWGFNGSGQLGDGTINQKLVPAQVSHSSGIGFLTSGVAIAAGSIYSMAVQTDGTTLAWGDNTNGQLGDGTSTLTRLPVQASGLGSGSGVVKIAAGDSHSFAIKSDGAVFGWGANTAGQLGTGSFDGDPLPIVVLSSIDVVAAGATGSHNVALKTDGTVLAWGFNLSGQLGDGTQTTKFTPVQVSGLGINSGVVAVAAGGSHSLALKSDGTVSSWGANTNGQLGNGSTGQRTTPGPVTGLGNISAIAAGTSFSLALGFDGSVWAWGLNGSGQLGDGTLLQRTTPVPVSGLGAGSGVIAIAAGNTHAIAMKSDGTVWTWGSNTNGQLGDASQLQRTAPVQVADISGVGFLTGATGIAAGGTHSFALKSNGAVWAWGLNTSGQLGDGSITQRNIPVEVTTLGAGSGIVKMSAGATHSVATKADGAILAWGSNSNGQLGDGTLENRRTPVTSVVTGGVKIAAGNAHSVAVAAEAAPADTTPPSITVAVTGTLGNNGWYRSDVNVAWTVTDPETQISSQTGCSSTTVDTETAGTSLTCSATNAAGLSASSSVTVKIDKTGPHVYYSRTAANANGWNNTPVRVVFTATDAMSGIDGAALIEQNLTAEGQNQSASATFTDLAGNSASAGGTGINIDLTAPTLQFGVPSPAANSAGWNNTDVVISFTAADALSGVGSTSVPSPLMLNTEGSNVTGTVIVTDLADNRAAFVSPAVKIDKTKPVASASASPQVAPGQRINGDVTVTFTGTDSLSGIAACSAPVVLNQPGDNQSATGSCTDKAGNVSLPVTISGINIDKTPVTPVSITGMPAPNCTIWTPNKKLVQIAAIRAAGPAAANSLVVEVTANEPVNASDIVITAGVVQVRADRNGNGKGRIYTVVARAADLAGNAIVARGSCIVPHDNRLSSNDPATR